MNFFSTPLDVAAHPAVVAPMTGHQVEVNSNGGVNTAMTPVSWPNYLGGGAILLGLVAMVAVARASASPVSRRQKNVTDLSKIHRANVVKNLEHRLQAAKDRGDQNLIHLLEQERTQIG